ncbi:MAG TPA: tetratricopeptide repeat protein [Rhodanobacteraceae bacterium]|nr:tetratricopeptide repeat protein [Rhodanobacteraceae bacterium]
MPKPGRAEPTLHRLAFCAGLGVLLVGAWLAYHPGLSGNFLFDDYANLPALGATGPIDHWATFWRYLTSGTADPTGRPLTLLSFLLDARDWPANPWPFKVTNLLLHLLNGVLLCAVLLRLGRALHLSGFRARAAALFGAGAWLLHPLFVSTTLYIVQREAMLPATFALLGMLSWIAARGALANGNVVRGLTGMTLAAGGCTLLAVLSKGNGALLPLFLLLTEWIVLAPSQPMPSARLERKRRIAVAVLLALPSLLFFAWLLAQIPSSVRFAASMRDWSVPQRLLSEARALVEYLAMLWLPRAYSRGLFTDGFAASTGLLHPWTTLPCVLIVFALIAGALALRRKHPALALAILFYFAGQLIESTWLSLELYYEHRNYLPAMLMFWPAGIALFSAEKYRWRGAAVAIAILALLGTMTFFRASLWGDAYAQALVWAAQNPDSARAQANAAQFETAHGHPERAIARLLPLIPRHPDDIQLPVNLIGAECHLGGVEASTLAALDSALERSRSGTQLAFHWFDEALDLAKRRACPGLDFASLQAMLDSARRNPNWTNLSGVQKDLEHMQGQLDLSRGRPQATLMAFDNAYLRKPDQETALQQAAMLGAAGYPAYGLQHLDFADRHPASAPPAFGMPRIHAWVLQRQHYWENETVRLRATLEADVAARAKSEGSANTPASG